MRITEAEIGHLRRILESPDDEIVRQEYISYLYSTGAGYRALILQQWPEGPRNEQANYYNASYMFGRFGVETGWQPGDLVPQEWPTRPFRNKKWVFQTRPWYAFFGNILLDHLEDAAAWLREMERRYDASKREALLGH